MSTSAATEEQQTKEKLLDLSIPQIAAAALAAVTAAILGSNLGVAGTLGGAAAASAVYSVSSSLYQRGLERGRQKVRAAIPTLTKPLPLSRTGSRAPTSPVGTTVPPADPQQPTEHPDPDVTQTMLVAGAPEGPVPPSRKHGRIRWLAVGLGAAVVFGIAMVVVTGFEAAAGQPLGGGSERGTSVGQLLDGPLVQVPPDTPQDTDAPPTIVPETEPTGVPEYGSGSERTDVPGADGSGNRDSGNRDTEATGSSDGDQQDQPEPTGRRDGPLPGGLIG